MKQRKRCPKCSSDAVGHLDHLPDTMSSEQEISEQALGLVVKASGPEKVGVIEAYVCTACGFMETYVKDPTGVPFEEIVGFSWVTAEDGHPYR
jgi:hypothetical protein